jgi:hypothetical protein
MSSVTLRWLSKKCQEANKQGHEAKPMSLAKTRTPPECGIAKRGCPGGVSGTLIWLGEPRAMYEGSASQTHGGGQKFPQHPAMTPPSRTP